MVEGTITEGDATHVARHDPARVLAECEAKRRIVEMHADQGESQGYGVGAGGGYGYMDNTCSTCGTFGEYGIAWPCPTIRALASVYADHPAYREEWKP